MRMQNAFQEERDLLSHAFHLSLDWRSYLIQSLGLIGALFIFRLFFELGAGSAEHGWPTLRYVFILFGTGLAYCWLSAANTLVVKITDEKLRGHLGVSTTLLQQFVDKHLVSVIVMPTVCYAIVLLVTLVLTVFAEIGLVEPVGNFLLAVLIVPMFIVAVFGFAVTYIGLFELPALMGSEEATPRQNLAELLTMIRRLFSRLFFRHTLAILGAFLIAVPLCAISGTSMMLINVVMKEVTGKKAPIVRTSDAIIGSNAPAPVGEHPLGGRVSLAPPGSLPVAEPGHGLREHVEAFGPTPERMLANASFNIVLALVFALPASFLSIASFMINRAAQETIDEERRAYLE